MQRHKDQGGCENFDGEPHTVAQCKAMAARIERGARARSIYAAPAATAPAKSLDTDDIEDLRIVAASVPSQWMQNYAPGMAATIRMNAERARALLRERGISA